MSELMLKKFCLKNSIQNTLQSLHRSENKTNDIACEPDLILYRIKEIVIKSQTYFSRLDDSNEPFKFDLSQNIFNLRIIEKSDLAKKLFRSIGFTFSDDFKYVSLEHESYIVNKSFFILIVDKIEMFNWENCFNEIIPQKLYLGSMRASKNLKMLKKYNIRRILVCGEMLEEHFKSDFLYKRYDISDTMSEKIIDFFADSYSYIDTGNVFIHCAAGVSRSSSFTIAYIMRKYKVSFEKAFEYVKTRRSCIQPNYGFIRQLKEYSEKLRKEYSISEDEWAKKNLKII